jgi:adenylosuccinate lyase
MVEGASCHAKNPLRQRYALPPPPSLGGICERRTPLLAAPGMVPRYSRPEMTAIWSAENRYRIWFAIEVFAAEAMGRAGVIPADDAAKIRAAYDAGALGGIDIAAIDEIEAVTRHDVIAFLTWVGSKLGPESRFLHQGMTSSDVLDTALAVQLKQAADLLIADLDELLTVLKRRALEHKRTPTIGRSHGIHAEPTSFGLKLAQAYAEFDRARSRLIAARDDVATCAISGAVGTFANFSPEVEAHVAAELGLKPEPVSTQIIPRDRHAMFFATLAVIASSIERLATEIRHLQRTEVLEVEEFFASGQKGSSAMPHKRNPVLSENLTGLARMVRSAVTPALENVALWHERDISHSSVERFISPDATITLDFALARLTGLIDQLRIYPERMGKNLERMGGLVHSQRVLLALTQAGLSREDSYSLVQRHAMKVWDSDGQLSLLDLLKNDAEVARHLSADRLDALFDLDYHLKHVDTIFERVFGPMA